MVGGFVGVCMYVCVYRYEKKARTIKRDTVGFTGEERAGAGASPSRCARGYGGIYLRWRHLPWRQVRLKLHQLPWKIGMRINARPEKKKRRKGGGGRRESGRTQRPQLRESLRVLTHLVPHAVKLRVIKQGEQRTHRRVSARGRGVHTIYESTGRCLSCTAEWRHICGSKYRRRLRRVGGSGKCPDRDDVFLCTKNKSIKSNMDGLDGWMVCKPGQVSGVRTAESLARAGATDRAR